MSLISKQIDELRAYAKDRKGELAKLINDAADTIEMLSAKIQVVIEKEPGEDVKPVVHAHWIPECPNKRNKKAYRHTCSECGRTVYNARQVSIDEMGYAFCPHCGAKMDEEAGNDTGTER